MKSDGEGCREDKWCMETRFTSFDKVNYIKYIYMMGALKSLLKRGGSKSHTSGQTTVKTTRKPSKNTFFPAKQEKNTRKRT